MKARLKKNGALIFIATAILLFLPRLFFRAQLAHWQDDMAEVFGFTFILLGFIWRISARGYKSEQSRQGNSLVKTGPYSAQRNPMYFGIVLIGIGVILILFNIWALTLFLIFFVGRYFMLIFQEEKQLILKFKDDYKAYMKSVPRLMPSVSTFFSREIKEILPIKKQWVKKEIGSFLATVAGMLIIESWEDVRIDGLKIYMIESVTFLLILVFFFWLINYLNTNRN